MASEEPKEIKVNKWDSCAVKNALDDAVREIFVDKLKYIENHKLMDRRLIISGIAVGIALFALGYDFFYPFPKSRTALLVCVFSYFTMMAVLSVYVTYIEKGIFVTAIQRDPLGYDPDVIWQASSNMKKYDDIYSLTLTVRSIDTKISQQKTLTKSVAKFFDEDGVLVEELLYQAVLSLHNGFSIKSKNS